jgi:hypothetical protein
VSNAAIEPLPYRVAYSGSAKQRLVVLADMARERDDGEEFLGVLK